MDDEGRNGERGGSLFLLRWVVGGRDGGIS